MGSSLGCSEYIALPEDVELARKMDALGLPVSFHTNKEVESA